MSGSQVLWLAAAAVLAGLLLQRSVAVGARPDAAPASADTELALRPVADDPALPRVLLIGDSISIGYTLPVRARLEGRANVHRPPQNCGPTTRGLEQIDSWLGDGAWDVIHFNFGLHDMKHLGPEGENRADPTAPGSHRQVALDAYAENLTRLVLRLQQTGAHLIWRPTTLVPEGARGFVPGDVARYNAAAARIMQAHGVATDERLARALPRLAALQRPADVHFSEAGYLALGREVARTLEAALPDAPRRR